MRIKIPEFSLILLLGPSSSGKTTFAEKHFKKSQIVSSSYCRYLLSDDENNPSVNELAYELMEYMIEKRLRLRKLTVVDATNVLEETRKKWLDIAKQNHCLTVVLVFNLPMNVYLDRNVRHLDEKILEDQYHQMQFSLMNLKKEGFNFIYTFNSIGDILKAYVYTDSLYCDKSYDSGPFDIIGDVHGCFDELVLLLEKCGYKIKKINDLYQVHHPENRKVIFVGDLVDRGPKIVEVLKLAMSMVKSQQAYCVQGNHDNKLYRKLEGRNVQVKNGLEDSVRELAATSDEFREEVKYFLKYLDSHLIFDHLKLVVCHAGIKEEYIGRTSKKIRSYTLYGQTSNETDEFGLPKRYLWAKDYKGKALIIYGHTPHLEPLKLNNTINIDTGCVFGNTLTAYQYPEGKLISVKASRQYSTPSRPVK